MLGILGVDERTERVYRELVQLGPCSVETLALRLGLGRPLVVEAIGILESKSLATRSAGGLVHTAPPQLALGALLTAQRHALGQAELTAAALAEAYHAASAQQNAHELVEVVIGEDQVAQRLEHIQHNAEAELLRLVQARVEVPAACESEAETAAVRRGVRYRVVVERAGLDGPHGRSMGGIALAQPITEQVRVAESVPTKLVIADRNTVILPLSEPGSPLVARVAGAAGNVVDGDEGPMALISRAPGLVTAMVGLFESVWQRALPMRPMVGGEAGGGAARGAAHAAGPADPLAAPGGRDGCGDRQAARPRPADRAAAGGAHDGARRGEHPAATRLAGARPRLAEVTRSRISPQR